jgi:hypothetical protein
VIDAISRSAGSLIVARPPANGVVSGEPGALARIQAVSDRLILVWAQLAIAREYGFDSWPRLKREVERRDILNSRDLDRLATLLADEPDLAVRRMTNWADHRHANPLNYVAMIGFDHERLGLPADGWPPTTSGCRSSTS